MRLHLAQGVSPEWEMQLEQLFAAPVPNLLGHINLQKLLALDALVHLHHGRREPALETLEAAWTLMGSLRDSPFLISQLIRIADARMILGVLRQLPGPPPHWAERLRGEDFHGPLVASLKYEAWIWTQVDDLAEVSLGDLAGSVVGKAAEPYMKFCLAHTSDALRRRIDRLEQLGAICDYDLEERGASLEVSVPVWNMIGRIISAERSHGRGPPPGPAGAGPGADPRADRARVGAGRERALARQARPRRALARLPAGRMDLRAHARSSRDADLLRSHARVARPAGARPATRLRQRGLPRRALPLRGRAGS